MDRVKNVISPEHLKRKGVPSPCMKNMRCNDCIGPHRACAVTSIIESSPPHTRIHVIIVDEDLGLGWDRSWPEERINRIIKRHEEHMVLCPMPDCIFEKENNVLQSLNLRPVRFKNTSSNEALLNSIKCGGSLSSSRSINSLEFSLEGL